MKPPARILIIGNSGAGKSFLGERLGRKLRIDWVPLDSIHWEPGGFEAKRDEVVALRMVGAAVEKEAWIIEGVYGWLAEAALSRAQILIWLDLPWDSCRAGLLARGVDGEKDGRVLWRWAENYWARQSSCSFGAHERIFENFSGDKSRIRHREEFAPLIAGLCGETAP